MKLFYRLLILLALCLSNIATAQLYTFKNFGHKEGLSIANIKTFLQTEKGTIWLGTDGAGIVSFDGYSFKEFPTNSLNKDHHVTSIIEHGNELIFTSLYKGLFSFSDGKYKLLSPIYDEVGGFLKTFECKGKIFYITTKGIFKYREGNDVKLFAFAKSDKELEITSIIPNEHGAIILTSSGNFFLSEKNDRISPLNNWLHAGKKNVNFFKFGYQKGDKITLYNDRLSKELTIILNDKGQIYKLDYRDRPEVLEPGVTISSFNGNQLGVVFLTSKNTIWKKQGNTYSPIVHNYLQQLEMCGSVLLDQNDDIWITSSLKGLYKVSLEPFTKIQLHPVYNSASICALHRSKKGDVLISTMEGQTNIGQISDQNNAFKNYEFQTNTVAEYDNVLFLGTNKGIKQFDLTTKTITSLNFNDFTENKITLLFVHDGIIYCGIAEKGLTAYDLTKNFEPVKLRLDPNTYPYIYTAQVTNDYKKIVFGTNNGIVTLNLDEPKFSKVPVPKSAGSYSGVSIKDVHGNLWFTCDHALIGILKNGELKVLDDPKMFPSTLFYTLNSDNYGNLILGTNKGINIINVSEYGDVISYKWYTGTSGFDGYETHMRSQFQNDNSIFVGTVEGLFLINTSILQNIAVPKAPVIELLKNDAGALQFRYLVHNPKIKSIEYSYRVKGLNDEWSQLASINEISILDLPSGDFIIEVRATYNGVQFSEVGSFPFSVKIPFWQSKWFVFLLLFVLVGFNIFLINRNRSLATGKLFNTKDTSFNFKLTPTIILAGLIADTSMHLLAPQIDSGVSNNLAVTLIEGFVLLFLYLSSLSAKRSHNTEQYKIFLTSAFLIVMAHNFFDLYSSNLHPFFILGVVIINALTPFIFERVSAVLIFSTIYILTGCIFVLTLEKTVYNEFLFLLALIISVVLSIFGAFLRYDSMEKLIFISGVINKGDVPAIAFNSQGIMTYVSENIKNMISANHESLIGQHLSTLNTFVPEEGNYRKVDLTQDFEDGRKYLVPMISKDGDLKWMEWSCKVFNEDVKVILGQNVTDRMELENTYELLVQNAEDLIYQCDINGNFSFLNKRCYEKLGYNENELIGKHSMTLIPEEYVEEVSNFYRHHFEKRKESSYFEFPIRQKNGSIIWVGQYVTTLYKPGEIKIVNGFLALARDITLMRHQQQVIKEQRDDITSSINYAQKIQLNLLPGKEKFYRSFEENCIFYRPKDIVSGDFFWLERIDDLSIMALADCTGHGVPGSFMTLLGINLLNSIILEQRIFNPGTILDELDKKLIAALPRANGEGNMSDGMEITICVIDHRTEELSYACAGSRFLIYESNSFTMYKGDTKHIGDKPSHGFRSYVTHVTKLYPASTLFLFTDGFQDQFGGTKDKKYSFRRMLELFEANIRLPLSEQEKMIEEEFETWRAGEIQTDDISIVSVRGPSEPFVQRYSE